MQTPKHILWDWNGTLQDDVQAAVNGINLLLRERSMPEVSLERHRNLFTFPVRGYYEALGFQLEHEDWDAMAHTFITAFTTDPTTRLFPGTRSTLQTLHDHGISQSIVTAAPSSVVSGLLSHYDLTPYIDQITGSSDPSAGSKVERARNFFSTLALEPSEVCIIGDTSHDKEVADALGCPCVLLAAGYESLERLHRNACPVLPSISEVPAFFGL